MSEPRRPRRRQELSAVDRQALLEQGAIATGELWAQSWRDELREQGRRVAGGWPGTLSEARARAHAVLASKLRRAGLAELTSDELERLARLTYARARNDWLSRAERNGPGDG